MKSISYSRLRKDSGEGKIGQGTLAFVLFLLLKIFQNIAFYKSTCMPQFHDKNFNQKNDSVRGNQWKAVLETIIIYKYLLLLPVLLATNLSM